MVPRIAARRPATTSGGLSRWDSTRQVIAIAIRAAAAIAECRAGLGLGGRPESVSTTGRRAIARAGHQAAALAQTTARRPDSAVRQHRRSWTAARWTRKVVRRERTT